MSQSPFYLEHYLDSLETLPGELRRNFTKMTDKDVMNKEIMVQIDGTSDDYLRKVRDLSPTKRKAEMEKIQVREISALGDYLDFCEFGWLAVVVLLVIGLSKGLPGGNRDPHTPSACSSQMSISHDCVGFSQFPLSSSFVHGVHTVRQVPPCLPSFFHPRFAKWLNREQHTSSPTHQTPRQPASTLKTLSEHFLWFGSPVMLE